MGCTSPELARWHGGRAMPVIGALLLMLALPASTAKADDPAVKDLLGKAQSQSETKAVEDLISKLTGRSKTPAARPAEPAKTEAGTTPGAGPGGGADAKAPTRPDTSAVPDVSKSETTTKDAGAVAADTAVKSSEAEPMPSVDLEVTFEYNSARIAPAAVATLTTLGRALTDARLAGDSFLIAGHTDAKGGADYNLKLSQQRADSVRQFLIDNFGMEASRLVARGFGQKHLKDERNPLSAENRRVQIVNFAPPKRQ